MFSSGTKDFGTFKITRDGRVKVSDVHLLELVRQETALVNLGVEQASGQLAVPTSYETAAKHYSSL